MADRENEEHQSRFRDMTKLVTLLFILFLTFGYGQKKPIRAWQKEGAEPYYLYFPDNRYYGRDIMATPLQQVTIKENFNNLLENKFITDFYEYSKREFEPTLKDTFTISEKELDYIKGAYRYSETMITKNYTEETYDSIVVQSETSDILNGFYKVKSTPAHTKYDYYLGYFFKGDPYIIGGNNVFEYYKNNKFYKRRFFVHTLFPTKTFFSYGQITEDYFPISKRKWRREIRTWPGEGLMVEDTVVYKNGKSYIDGIQNIYNDWEYIIYWTAQNPNNIEFKRLLAQNSNTTDFKRLLIKSHNYEKGYIRSVTEYNYVHDHQDFPLLRIKKLNIPKRGSMTAEIEKYDPSGRLLYSGTYKNAPVNQSKSDREKCPNDRFKFDKEYTNIERDDQCFQPVGEHYFLDPHYVYSQGKHKSTFKLDSFTLEYQAYFEKGLLVKFIEKRPFPIERLDDSITQKVYVKPLEAYEEKVNDYKKRISTTEYLTYPDKKLIIRIIKKYENCIEIFFPIRGWYKAYCEDESLRRKYEEKYKLKQFLEYYNPSGKKIIDKEFTGRYEDFLNNYPKN